MINYKLLASIVLSGSGIGIFLSDLLGNYALFPIGFILSSIFWKLTKKKHPQGLYLLPLTILAVTPIRNLIQFLPQHQSFSNLIPYLIAIAPLSLSLFIFLTKVKVKIPRVSNKWFFIIPIAYFIIFSTLAILKHYSFVSTAYDLGIYDQTVWHYSQGRLGPTSIWWGNILLGGHVQPILFLLAPIYKLFPFPITLLIIQTGFIAWAAHPLYKLSKKYLKDDFATFAVILTFFLYPSIQFANLFDFHPLTLAIPLVMYATYYLLENQIQKFWTFIILAAFCKEYLTLLLVPAGIFMAINHKKWLQGAFASVIGAVWFYVNIFVIIPHFYQDTYYALSLNSYFGTTLSEIISNTLLNPAKVITYLATFDKLAFLILLTLPIFFGLFALFGLDILFLVISEIGIVFLYNPTSISDIVYHHQVIIVSFLVMSTIIGMSRIKKKFKKITLPSMGLTLIFTAIAASVVIGPFSILYDLNELNPRSQYVKNGYDIINQIPPDASVSAPNWILSHVSHRDHAFMYPHFFDRNERFQDSYPGLTAQYVLLDLSEAIVDPKRSSNHLNKDNINFIINHQDYGIQEVRGSWILFNQGLDHTENICSILPFLDSAQYPHLSIEITEDLSKCSR